MTWEQHRANAAKRNTRHAELEARAGTLRAEASQLGEEMHTSKPSDTRAWELNIRIGAIGDELADIWRVQRELQAAGQTERDALDDAGQGCNEPSRTGGRAMTTEIATYTNAADGVAAHVTRNDAGRYCVRACHTLMRSYEKAGDEENAREYLRRGLAIKAELAKLES